MVPSTFRMNHLKAYINCTQAHTHTHVFIYLFMTNAIYFDSHAQPRLQENTYYVHKLN